MGSAAGGIVAAVFAAILAIVVIVLLAIIFGALIAVGVYAWKKRAARPCGGNRMKDLAPLAFQFENAKFSFGAEDLLKLEKCLLEDNGVVRQSLVECVEIVKSTDIIKAVIYLNHIHNTETPRDRLHSAVQRSSLVNSSFNDSNINFVIDLLDDSVDAELHPESLFRVDGRSTKALRLYMMMIGLPYLHDTIKESLLNVMRWANSGASVELDPNRMTEDDDADLSLYTLMSLTQRLLVDILRSVDTIPREFRVIAHWLNGRVRSKFPGNNNVGHIALANMFFLRFYCSAILSPQVVGISHDPPHGNVQRALMLVTKVMQNLANGVMFGGKEKHMIALNQFIEKNRPKVETFYDQVASLPATEPMTSDYVWPPPHHTREWCLGTVAELVTSNVEKLVEMPRLKNDNAMLTLFNDSTVSLRPNPPSPEECQICGYIYRSQAGRKNKVYAMLKQEHLWFFKSEPGVGPQGLLVLTNCIVLSANAPKRSQGKPPSSLGPGNNITINGALGRDMAKSSAAAVDDAGQKVYGFMIDSQCSGTEYLYASTEMDRRQWLNALHMAISKARLKDGGNVMSVVSSCSMRRLSHLKMPSQHSQAHPLLAKSQGLSDGSSPANDGIGRGDIEMASLQTLDSTEVHAPPSITDGWLEMMTDDGAKYFHNVYTDEARWERPTNMVLDPEALSEIVNSTADIQHAIMSYNEVTRHVSSPGSSVGSLTYYGEDGRGKVAGKNLPKTIIEESLESPGVGNSNGNALLVANNVPSGTFTRNPAHSISQIEAAPSSLESDAPFEENGIEKADTSRGAVGKLQPKNDLPHLNTSNLQGGGTTATPASVAAGHMKGSSVASEGSTSSAPRPPQKPAKLFQGMSRPQMDALATSLGTNSPMLDLMSPKLQLGGFTPTQTPTGSPAVPPKPSSLTKKVRELQTPSTPSPLQDR